MSPRPAVAVSAPAPPSPRSWPTPSTRLRASAPSLTEEAVGSPIARSGCRCPDHPQGVAVGPPRRRLTTAWDRPGSCRRPNRHLRSRSMADPVALAREPVVRDSVQCHREIARERGGADRSSSAAAVRVERSSERSSARKSNNPENASARRPQSATNTKPSTSAPRLGSTVKATLPIAVSARCGPANRQPITMLAARRHRASRVAAAARRRSLEVMHRI